MFHLCINLRDTVEVPESVDDDLFMFQGCPGVYDKDTRIYTADALSETNLFD